MFEWIREWWVVIILLIGLLFQTIKMVVDSQPPQPVTWQVRHYNSSGILKEEVLFENEMKINGIDGMWEIKKVK